MNSTFAIVLGILSLVAVMVGVVYVRRSRKRSSKGYAIPRMQVRTPEQELSDLGILEIRPKVSTKKGDSHSTEPIDAQGENEVGVVESVISVSEGEVVTEVVEDLEPSNPSVPESIKSKAPVENEALEEEAPDVLNSVTTKDQISDQAELELVYAPPEEVAGVVEDESMDSLAEHAANVQQMGVMGQAGIEEAVVLSEVSEAEAVDDTRSGVSRREALFRLLNALQASVDGYTACLLKEDQNNRLVIEAVVSQNPQVVNVDSSLSRAVFIDNHRIADAAVSVLDVSPRDIPFESLEYYRQPVDIRQIAVARVKIPDNAQVFYLTVDALAWQDLDDPWQRLMIGQFANLLGTFMATPQLDVRGVERIKQRIKPRREIIEEEMARSRSGDTPLALALIYLNKAEDVSDDGPKAVVDAEHALYEFLESALDDVRIERFGELTFGVFHEEDVSEVEAWALLLQEEVEHMDDYFFEKGISIGIAILQDHHKRADDFRADATEALRESFETGACTIIE